MPPINPLIIPQLITFLSFPLRSPFSEILFLLASYPMGLLQVREAWQVVNLGKRLAPPPCDKENEKSPYRKGRLNSTHGSMEPLEVSVSNLTPKAFLLSIASWSK